MTDPNQIFIRVFFSFWFYWL